MDKYSNLRDLVASLEGDFEKFFLKSNKAAGTRVRKGMQEIKALAQAIRQEIQDKKTDE